MKEKTLAMILALTITVVYGLIIYGVYKLITTII
jgi:hypothetical protein